MAITIQLTPAAEASLREAFGERLERLALEGLLIEAYRCGEVSAAYLAEILSLGNRWDAERWLADRGVTRNYDIEDFEQDVRTLDRFFGRKTA